MIFAHTNNLISGLLLVISTTLSGCTREAPKFLCFRNPDDNKENICYPLDMLTERNPLVITAIEKFANNLGNPGDLVTMSPDMAAHYTRDKFENALKKSFHGINRDSIRHIINNGPYSAVLLDTGSTLYYSHDTQSFMFSFDEPIPFGGLAHYFGSGMLPTKRAFTALDSSCNLTRDGILFISEQKDHKLYSEIGTFCEYDGYYFKKQGDEISVRKSGQIGQGYSLITDVGFTKFLLWMNKSYRQTRD